MKVSIVKLNHNMDGGDNSIIVGASKSFQDAQTIMMKHYENLKTEDEFKDFLHVGDWVEEINESHIVLIEECDAYWFSYEIVEVNL